MSRKALFAVGWCMAVVSGVALASTPLTRPDCPALQNWAAGAGQRTFEPRPGMKLNVLLADERVEPLFGRGVLAWERKDFDDVMRWLGACRQSAIKARDKAAGQTLYQAGRTLKADLRPLKQYWGQRLLIERQVDSLAQSRDDPELAKVLDLAKRALHGEDVRAEVGGLDRRVQGQGRQASELVKAREYFSEAEIDGLVGQLEARRAEAATAAAERQARLQTVLDQIAAVPMTEAGLGQINRIAVQVMQGEPLPPADYDRYNAALQGKRRMIQAKVKRERAAAVQARATQPAPAADELGALLKGDRVADLSFRGLALGMPYARAGELAKSGWGYAQGAGGDVFKQFTTTVRQLNQYREQESRDGGMLEFATMRGAVGKMIYTEHFTGPLDAAPLRAALSERLGRPDQTGTEAGVAMMQWDGGDRHLKVVAGNRIAKFERGGLGFQSSVVVILWSQAYSDYLAEAERRCAKLRDKPMSELSVNERQALLMGCETP